MRLNNYAINLLKLQHKINLKFLDTNKNTNNFFWCPTGWGNAKIMGANKNIPNFSGLIMSTSLLQSSKCFRQKNFLFSTAECCVSVHPDKNSFSQADFRASRSCVCSCIWHLLPFWNTLFVSQKLQTEMARQDVALFLPWGQFRLNPAAWQNSLPRWTTIEQRQTSHLKQGRAKTATAPTKHGGSTKKTPKRQHGRHSTASFCRL